MNDAINIKCAWCEQSFPVSIMIRGDDGQLRCAQHHHMKQLSDDLTPERKPLVWDRTMSADNDELSDSRHL